MRRSSVPSLPTKLEFLALIQTSALPRMFSGHATGSSSNYRPAFLDHFDNSNKAEKPARDQTPAAQPPAPSAPPAPATSSAEQLAYQRQFDQVPILWVAEHSTYNLEMGWG